MFSRTSPGTVEREAGRRPARWGRSVAALAILAATLVVLTGGNQAGATGETLTVLVSQTDGTTPFDATDAAGYDSGASNDIVRTNDNMTYTVEVGVADADAEGVTVTLPLPQGQEALALPPYCGAGSGVSPALSAPALPITATSWLSLPAQTITCVIGHRDGGSTESYVFVAKVRPEVPNGTVFPAVTASAASTDAPTPATSSPTTPVTVSARAKLDMSKNALAQVENTGGVGSQKGLCSDGSGRLCQFYWFPLSISVKDPFGRGNSPILGDITLTDDLTAASLYGSNVTSDPDWVAAGANAAAKYGAILNECLDIAGVSMPAHAIGATEPNGILPTADTAARDSGTIACTQAGGPGTSAAVTISGADTSAYTYPTKANYPVGEVLPVGQAVVVSQQISIEVPDQAVTDLGNFSGNTYSLNVDNKFLNLTAVGLDGTASDPASNETWNDHRALVDVLGNPGGFDKAFVGVPGATGNKSPVEFSADYPFAEGPTGTTAVRTGDGTLLIGQRVVSMLTFKNGGSPGMPAQNYVGCDGWDNTKLALAAGNYPASAYGPYGQTTASNGAAVWASGANHARTATSYTGPITIEYGNGPTGAGMTCDASDSPGGWHTDPAAVPGNDPALAATGVYTGVTKVRVFMKLTPFNDTDIYDAFVSIGLQALPNPIGTVLPNYASVKNSVGDAVTEASLLADASAPWQKSTYDASDASGKLGDRMRLGAAVSRLKKEVKDQAGTFVTTTPSYTSGDTVSYRLSPSLTAGTTVDAQVPVKVEDCLPADESFVVGSASLDPEVVDSTPPADAEITCAAGETYVRWNLGPQQINSTLPQITYDTVVSPTASDGTKENRALVAAEGDPSTVAQRSAKAEIQVTSPAGIKIDKKALKPLIEVNRAGETNPATLDWRVTFANIAVPTGVTDVDVIDVLPAAGTAGSSFGGSLAFKDATLSTGTGVQVLYTSAASPNLDPADLSNAPSGPTAWCDAPTGGNVVSGSGGCPATAADVTGLRFLRPGPFTPADGFSVDVSLVPTGNAKDDVYVNRTEGRATGLQLPVGPVGAPEVVTASSIGDYVWDDANMNGVQDAGEAPISNFTVTLQGTDSDGNTVGPLTTTTDGNGKYHFTGLQSGNYTVTFDPASLTAGQHFTVRNTPSDDTADADGDPSTGKASVALPANFVDDTVDEGVFTARPSISVVKSINGDTADTAPGVMVEPGTTMDVTFLITNTGNMALDPVVLSDDTIAPADISCPQTALPVGGSETCTATIPTPEANVQHTNTATVTGTPVPLPDGSQLIDVTDDDPANAKGYPSDIHVTKKLVAKPVVEADNSLTATYLITVNNTGRGRDAYDLDDELRFGDGITVNSAAVVNTAPGGLTVNAGWNGTSDTSVISARVLAAGGTDTYTVTVNASVGTSTTVAQADCTLSSGETGTGLLNAAVLSVHGATAEATDCGEQDPKITLTKTLAGTPTANGDGTWTVDYDVVATNTGPVPGTYSLSDAVKFGDGAKVVAATATNTDPGSIDVEPGWDGVDATTVVADQPIGVGVAHTYRVSVKVSVAPDITTAASDCTAATDEPGTGFLNTAELSYAGQKADAQACAAIPSISIVKKIEGTPKVGADGSIAVDYTLTVTNTGAGDGSYDLLDKVMWGAGLDVTGATVTATPQDVTASATWDGVKDTTIASDVVLAGGASHVWEVHLTGTATRVRTKASGDCTVDQGEKGSGLLNTATVRSGGGTADSSACAPVEPPKQESRPTPPGSTPPRGELPFTGAEVLQLGLLGAGALVLGFVLLTVGGRRRARSNG